MQCFAFHITENKGYDFDRYNVDDTICQDRIKTAELPRAVLFERLSFVLYNLLSWNEQFGSYDVGNKIMNIYRTTNFHTFKRIFLLKTITENIQLRLIINGKLKKPNVNQTNHIRRRFVLRKPCYLRSLVFSKHF